MKKAFSLIPTVLMAIVLMVPVSALAGGDQKGDAGHTLDSAKSKLMEEGSGSSAMDASTGMQGSSNEMEHMMKDGPEGAMGASTMKHKGETEMNKGMEEGSNGEKAMHKVKEIKEKGGM